MSARASLTVFKVPSRATSLAVSAALTVTWVALRLGVFQSTIFPLTYALPLFVCVWTRDRVALWGMAAVFALAHTVKQFVLLPPDGLHADLDWAIQIATLVNIVVGAAAVHAIIRLRERLQAAVHEAQTHEAQAREYAERVRAQAEELAEQNEELSQQAEELSQQSEELTEQTEELTRQAEELSVQNEELQAQAEEINLLNTELGGREALLQSLLDSARVTVTEQMVLQRICSAALDLLGPQAETAVVLERVSDHLIVRGMASAGGECVTPVSSSGDGRFASLVIQQNRTAALADTSLRPDLSVLEVPGKGAFKAVLCAPIHLGGRTFGAFGVYSPQVHQWTDEQFRLAEWVAAQCAQMLEIVRLQEDLRRQAELIDLAPDAFMVRRMDGTISFWSRGAEMLYGHTREEACGQSSHVLLSSRFPRPLAEIEQEVLERGHWTGEVTQRIKDGRELIVESRWLAQRNERGRVVDVFECNVDITERTRAERALREADQHKNRFLATLSHELRNPLAPIRYALELLSRSDGHPGASHPRQVIERQLAHLVRLVDDLLDVTRIASDKIRLQKQRVNVESVVRQALEAALPDIEAAEHRLDLSFPGDPVWLDADPHRLAQAVTNLLNNAARYTPPGGCIRTTVEALDGEAVIRVADSGIGLEPHDLEHVFEMFQQVGDPGRGGLGIGLALVKGIVELHGGRIRAHSEGPGRGAEFLITLPRAQVGEPATTASECGAATAGEIRRVLVVDDNVDAAEMMRAVLECEGHDVQVAYDGTSAFRAACDRPPDLALLDIGLPDMTGYDLARRLREEPRTAGARLVAITGWGQEEDRQRARESGFDEHLTKPASPDDICRLAATCPVVREAFGPESDIPFRA